MKYLFPILCTLLLTTTIHCNETTQPLETTPTTSQTPQTTHRVFQFENEHVKVWKTVIMPHQPLNLHRHDYSRVIVGLKGGALKKIEETGEVSDLVFETGKAYWLTEDAPGTLHGDINESDEPIEVMVIEMKNENEVNILPGY